MVTFSLLKVFCVCITGMHVDEQQRGAVRHLSGPWQSLCSIMDLGSKQSCSGTKSAVMIGLAGKGVLLLPTEGVTGH